MSGITAMSSVQLWQLQSYKQCECKPDPDPEKGSGGPFTQAFKKLSGHMEHLSAEAQKYYDELEKKTNLSKEASALLSKETLNREEAIEFLNKHFPEGAKEWGSNTTDDDLKQGLQNFKTAQTDFVAESQLNIQRVMQTYNTTATLMNSLQSMLSDLNKSIIQKL